MRIRLNPLHLLFVALLALGLSLAFQTKVEMRREELRQASHHYTQALQTMRVDLAMLTRKLTADQTLQQNINWNLAHSVRSALEGRLVAGKLDAIMIVDANCQVIAQVHITPEASFDCDQESLGRSLNSEIYVWIRGKHAPMLTYATPILNSSHEGFDRPLVILGGVQINATWLHNQPELAHRLSSANLQLGEAGAADKQATSDKQATILREGVLKDGTALVALLSRSALDWQLAGILNERGIKYPLVWPCLITALLLTILAGLRERLQARAHRAGLQEFHNYCQDLLDPSTAPSVQEGSVVKIELKGIKSLVQRLQHQHTLSINTLRQQLTTSQNQANAQQSQLKQLQNRLAELAELDSLAVQLQRTTAGFLQRMGRIQQCTEHLSDLLNRGLNRDARHLSQTLNDWRAGIAARGVRKFLRSLSETEGETQGVSLLEEQLLSMAEVTAKLDDQAIHASLTCANLGKESAYSARIAGFWHGLAQKTNHDIETKPLRLPMVLETTLNLLRLDPVCAHMTLAPFAHDTESLKLAQSIVPALPERALASALYHVYLAVGQAYKGFKQVSLVSRLRLEGCKAMLIVSGSVAAGKPTHSPRSDNQAYHLEIARSILAPFKLSITALPVMGGGAFPIAISWLVETKVETSVVQMANGQPRPPVSGKDINPSVS